MKKRTELTFLEGFLGPPANKDKSTVRTFDWDKAAQIIKEKYQDHKDLIAEAGLQDDWNETGGVIFEEGCPTNESYTYLQSNWAIPTLILSYNGQEQEEIPCYVVDEDKIRSRRWGSESTWDSPSLAILGIDLE